MPHNLQSLPSNVIKLKFNRYTVIGSMQSIFIFYLPWPNLQSYNCFELSGDMTMISTSHPIWCESSMIPHWMEQRCVCTTTVTLGGQTCMGGLFTTRVIAWLLMALPELDLFVSAVFLNIYRLLIPVSFLFIEIIAKTKRTVVMDFSCRSQNENVLLSLTFNRSPPSLFSIFAILWVVE